MVTMNRLRLSAIAVLAGSLFSSPAFAAPPAAAGPTATPSSREVGEDPVLKGPTDLPDLPLKRFRGTIGTLLTTRGGTGASGISQFVRLSAVANKGTAGAPSDIGYDRFLGPLTMKSLGQVSQAVGTLHKGWPRGYKLQLVFSEHPAPVELGNATLAATLLLDSMARDWDIEPNLAVLGSIEPDGSLEAVGAIPDRLYAAARNRVARIVVPVKNEIQVADFLLGQGIAAFVGTQIFTAASFNDAGPLVVAQLAPETKEMMDLFGAVQRTLIGAGANSVSLLRNERVQATLQQVLTKAPHHLSAKVLYDWGTGKRATLSLNGSVDYIDRGAADLIHARSARPDEALKTPKQAVADNVARLRYVRERLDPVARPYAEALLKLGEVLQKAAGSSSRAPARLTGAMQKEFDAARDTATAEWTKMAQARINLPAPGTNP
jgi:hypothetical protein